MKDVVVRGLVLLALAQVGILVAVGTGVLPTGAESTVEAGSLLELDVVNELGYVGPIVAPEPTLLLVFHSECGHCQRVAPIWAEWLDEHRDALSVVAVSSEPIEAASAYSVGYEWAVPVRSVVNSEFGSTGHALTSRTPWIFVVDADGAVISSGHGGRIAELGAMLLDPRPDVTVPGS